MYSPKAETNNKYLYFLDVYSKASNKLIRRIFYFVTFINKNIRYEKN
ncbi:hypothetical protein I597_2111 [Dokdonia donghaensis DSW-1]|nr:hypothetical protein I597_2111 [Dokdonia donghaensis DSW-1]